MTAVILLITAAAAVSGLELTDPADVLSHKVLPLDISSETQYIELENIEQNTSLIPTTQQNPQDIPTIPPEKPEPAENMKLPEVDVLQEKPEEPDEPIQKPTEPPVQNEGSSSAVNKNVTKKVKFPLPTDRSEKYLVSLYLNGMQVIEDTMVSPGTAELDVVLTGSGTQTYVMYINNQEYKKVKVDFDAND